MSSSDRKLINAEFFKALREKTSTEEKKQDISNFLNAGANINEHFVNDSNNTPLHIAVQNEELAIVKFLLEHGANVNNINIANETALDIAKILGTSEKSAIIKILENAIQKEDVFADTDPKLVYQKRVGTSGIEGQLYETKLLSLVLIRALVHKKITQFSLGTSLNGIDALDDISIRYKAEDKEYIIFLQAKHRKDINKGRVTYQELWQSSGDFSLSKYFHSYLKIKEKFVNVNDDVIFEGTYKDVKCFFIICTPATHDLQEDNLKRTTLHPIVNELIWSGERCEIFQYKYTEKDIDSLKQIILVHDMKYLGKSLFEVKDKYNHIMNNEFICKFHVVLRQQVFNVSDVKPNGFRQGTFHEEFFTSNDILLVTIKETIFREAVSKTTPSKLILKARIQTLTNTLTADNLSKVLQIVNVHINVKQNTLEILDKRFKDFNNNLSTLKVSPSLFNNALELATYEKLHLLQFKLPNTFGNIDISAKNEKTINYLAKQIITIISKTNGTIINIDKNCIGRGKLVEPAIVEKGGLGSGIGNLLILDVNHEIKNMLKFNLDYKSLGVNSRNLLRIIKQNIPNLQEYRLQININNFPKLTFDEECNEITTTDFLDRMWFFTSQAKEDETEKYSKGVLYDYHNAKTSRNKKMSSVRCEAIFLKIHDAVQKWWLKTGKSYYLTNESQYYNKILNDFEGVSILNIVHCISVITMDKYNIEFNEDTINSLKLDGKFIIIETDINILTAKKLMQYFRTKNAEFGNCTFLDLDYVLSISGTDYESFKNDIRNTSLGALVIIFGNKGEDSGAKLNTIHWLVSETIIKKIIVVADKDTASVIKANNIENKFERIVVDNNLIDLTPDSQCVVLERNLLFQGTDIKWNIIINEQSKKIIKGDILIRILNKEKIELGKTLTNQKYEEIKDYYVTRSLRSPKTTIPVNKVDLYSHISHVLSPYSLDDSDNIKIIVIKTLQDLNNVIVLLGAPGMGKSTFLTHLSIATKKANPDLWIERINLIDYDFYFKDLRNNEIEMNKMEALKFVCKIVLSKKVQVRQDIKKSFYQIEFDIEIINGELRLKSFKDENIMALLTLELFIDCYNKRQTLFLFDGFDEVCSNHRVITLLKCLVSLPVNDYSENSCAKQKMWITSPSYNNIRRTLEAEFGAPYILEPFTDIEEELFMENYMKVNLKLSDLNNDQFENIDGLFEYVKLFADHVQCERKSMNVFQTKPYKLTNLLWHGLYFGAVKYFQSEIKHTPLYEEKRVYASKWNQLKLHRTTLTDHFSQIFKTEHEEFNYNRNMQNFIRTPLHMFVAIEYLKSKIKDTKTYNNDIRRKWNFDLTTFEFFERFFEEKLRKILFEEKYQVDLNNTKLEGIYEKERKELIDNHKKIAFYTIFKDDYNEILSEEVVVKINDSIKKMESGEEETGLIDYIINGVPKFIHFCFAEYLTVDYISDLIKTTSKPLEQRKLWNFVIHKLLFKKIRGVLCVFDLKLCNDSDLRNAILNLSVDVKEFILDELLKQKEKKSLDDFTVLDDVLLNSLGYIARILLIVVTDAVNKLNYGKFDMLIQKAVGFFCFCEMTDLTELLEIVFDCARNNGPTSSLDILKTKANNANNIVSSIGIEPNSNLQKKDFYYVYYK